MEERDLELRELTYRLFVDRGRAPTRDEVASVIGSTNADVVLLRRPRR